ncbi:hypothetical protein [Novosphingobium sp. TCA1]|uniref:hypothetical protein n=1 Tax=Novosphingobium sp. TCA1 TaxID=2682474 RepID=UPI0013077D75|nr:hypothetical protein [Novosphingobium sp. TCA1]GFE75524.1 hypothetical protein NTCA1_31730 [Novosphingobium sp. TCA1]
MGLDASAPDNTKIAAVGAQGTTADGKSRRAASRTCVLVLGMHRSGTSIFARIASLLGCDLPGNLMGASEGNHHGHWESNAVVTLNDQLLASAGSHWDDWLPMNAAWNASSVRENFFERAVDVLREEYGNSPLFVLKDPRICRLTPFWMDTLEEFGVQTVVAMPIRNPFEVAASLGARDGSQQGLGLLLWLRNALEAEKATREVPRLIFSYEQVLEDWNAVSTRFEQSTGLVWPRQTVRSAGEIDKFLERDARHQRVDDDLALGHRSPDWIRRAYSIFLRWAEEGEKAADYAELDKILDELNAASPSFAQVIMQGTGASEAVGHAERQRNELQAEVERLKQELDGRGDQHGELEHLRERIEAVTRERDEIERVSGEIAAELEKVRTESHASAANWANLDGELGALREQFAERQTDLQRQLDATRSEHQAAAKTSAEREGEVSALRVQANAFEARVDQLSSALRQREEEAVQAWGEVASEKRQRETLSLEVERFETSSKALRDKVSLLEDRLQARTQEFLASEAEVLKARWEAKEASWRADVAEKALERSEAELDKVRDEHGAALGRVSRYESEIAHLVQLKMQFQHQLQLQLEQATTEIASTKDALSHREWEISELVRAQAQLEERLSEAKAHRNETNKTDDVVRRIEQQHGEIAQLTRLVAEESGRALDLKMRTEWLSQLSEAQQRQPRWWVFLSETERKKRVKERIERMGLFDSGSYYSKNEDVAASGMDALEHYIRHGIFEGRSW